MLVDHEDSTVVRDAWSADSWLLGSILPCKCSAVLFFFLHRWNDVALDG